MQLLHKPFTKNISEFAPNSNTSRDFITNMFYMLLPCQIFVNENS